ncbi:telomerase inhibitor [Taxawa tesnikishii (nom. ined.)]|nr:telomerase inhibitor [Dothideales sp. JES 119]
MGLAGPKKRSKISHDPNNTSWARDTSSFGHKILASQGWTPGQYLGAKDAAHASHYTAANASHIRVLLKDDNLGLGAKRGTENAETFGLSLFSGILGRLNGKSDVELEKEQNAQRDVQLAMYQGRRWGHMNFVSAGFLVGDRIEDLVKPLVASKPSKSVETDNRATSPKRKRSAEEEDDDSQRGSDAEGDSKSKKRRSRKGRSEDTEGASSRDDETSAEDRKSSRKGSRREAEEAKSSSQAKKEKREERKKQRTRADSSGVVTPSTDSSSAGLSARKLEKLARKEERRRRREQKKLERAKDKAEEAQSSSDPETEATPAAAAPSFGGSRHAVRQRYIQQKRMASLSSQALKEIFMVKAAS